MADGELSFTAIEARLKAMPEGPAASLKTPDWIRWSSYISNAGIVCGLAPSLLVKIMAPQLWMLTMAKGGLLVALIFALPFFVRTLWVVMRGLSRHRDEMVEQLDHDLVEFRSFSRWLGGFPRDILQEHQRMARRCKERLESKLVLIAGGTHRLGALPIVAAVLSLLATHDKQYLLPSWWAIGLLALVMVYWIAMAGAHSVLRFQLYDNLLTDALERKSRTDA